MIETIPSEGQSSRLFTVLYCPVSELRRKEETEEK
jgi:hypothetical protein